MRADDPRTVLTVAPHPGQSHGRRSDAAAAAAFMLLKELQ